MRGADLFFRSTAFVQTILPFRSEEKRAGFFPPILHYHYLPADSAVSARLSTIVVRPLLLLEVTK